MRRFLLVGLCLALLMGVMCSKDKTDDAIRSAKIQLQLKGPLYQGDFYTGSIPPTDYAIWIETKDGLYVKTLKITKSIVSVAQYSHVEHLPVWKQKSGVTYDQLKLDILPDTVGISPFFDGVSGASPLFVDGSAPNTVTVNWDLTDKDGKAVAAGEYRFCAEVANITKGADAVVTIQAENTAGVLNLSTKNITSGAPTANIVSLTATLSTDDASGLAKSAGIFEPN